MSQKSRLEVAPFPKNDGVSVGYSTSGWTKETKLDGSGPEHLIFRKRKFSNDNNTNQRWLANSDLSSEIFKLRRWRFTSLSSHFGLTLNPCDGAGE